MEGPYPPYPPGYFYDLSETNSSNYRTALDPLKNEWIHPNVLLVSVFSSLTDNCFRVKPLKETCLSSYK